MHEGYGSVFARKPGTVLLYKGSRGRFFSIKREEKRGKERKGRGKGKREI